MNTKQVIFILATLCILLFTIGGALAFPTPHYPSNQYGFEARYTYGSWGQYSVYGAYGYYPNYYGYKPYGYRTYGYRYTPWDLRYGKVW